jgi:hypothetical protein
MEAIQDAELGLSLKWVAWEAEALRTDPNTRFMLLEDGEVITVETPRPLLLLHFSEIAKIDSMVVTKAEVQGAGGDVELAKWQGADHLYLAAIDDAREGATGRCFVDVMTSRPDYAEALRQLVGAGKGKIRTRKEMLTDPEPPGLASALGDWERGDNSLIAADQEPWVELVMSRLPKARANLRWGTLPEP